MGVSQEKGVSAMKYGALIGVLMMLAWLVPARADELDLCVGARPVSLGGSFVAVADDPNVIFLNPAGLVQMDRMEITVMGARLFPGIEGDKLGMGLVGLVLPAGGLGTLGLGVQMFMADRFNKDAFILSYARYLMGGLSLGVNLKGMMWKADLSGLNDPLGGSVSSGLKIGLDAGLFWRTPWKVRVGAFLRNINQPSIAKNTDLGGKLPMEVRVGVAYERLGMLATAELTSKDGVMDLSGGVEQRFGENFSVYLGGGQFLEKGKGSAKVNAGVGYTLWNMRLEYGYRYLLDLPVGGEHRISFGYRF